MADVKVNLHYGAAHNEAVVHKFYSSLFVGDWSSVAETIAPGFYLREAPLLPYAGDWRGIDGLKNLFTEIQKFWTGILIEHKGTCVSDEYAMWHATLSGSPGGTKLKADVIEMFTFENGLILTCRPFYFDTKEIQQILAADKAK